MSIGESVAGLADRVALVQKTVAGKQCGMSLVLDSLEGDDKESIVALLDRDSFGDVSNTTIHKFLIDEGYNVTFSSVRVHRQKNCRCFKRTPKSANAHD